MRIRTTKWFETTVRYDRHTDNGLKRVSENYVVDAITFAEAEETIIEELKPFLAGEFEVKNITPASYGEVFFSDDANHDRWYKAKLIFTVIDEKTEKEKAVSVTRLVQANSVSTALSNIEQVFGGSAQEYTVANIAETKIMDVFEHNEPLKKKADDKPEYEE